MSSTQIICPKCRNVLDKTPDLEVRGEIKKAGGYFIRLGDPDATLICPACGCQIRIEDIIDGKHDVPKGGWGDTIIMVVIMMVLFGVIVKCSG